MPLGSSGYGFLTTTRTAAVGGVVSLLAFVLSILSVGVGIFERPSIDIEYAPRLDVHCA
jgi:hypothetical protein